MAILISIIVRNQEIWKRLWRMASGEKEFRHGAHRHKCHKASNTKNGLGGEGRYRGRGKKTVNTKNVPRVRGSHRREVKGF